MAKKNYTEEQKAEILKRAAETSIVNAAKEFNVSAVTISRWKAADKATAVTIETKKKTRATGRKAKEKVETAAAEKKTTATKKEAAPNKAAAPKKEAAPKKAPAKKEAAPKKEAAAKEEKVGSYFVSPHPDGGWQVKKTKAQKALKIFKTKAEAEKYAKTVADNKGSNVVRQKKDGKIQKKH